MYSAPFCSVMRSLVVCALLACSSLLSAVDNPEVTVLRGASAVADGGTDTTTGSSAQSAYDLTYTVRNDGSTNNLVLGSVTAGTASNCTVSVVAQPAAVLTPGSVTAFTVRVTPTVAGAWSVPINFTTTDASEGLYDITITGTASAPVAEVSVLSGVIGVIDGGSAPPLTGTSAGLASAATYTIRNTGGATLNVTVPIRISSTSNCAAVVTMQPSSFVAAGASSNFDLSITPGQGAWSAIVEITNGDNPSDGDTEEFYTFTVSGTATGPEIAVSRSAFSILDGGTDVPAITTVAGEQASLTYSLVNTGAGALNITRYPEDAQAGVFQFAAVRHWVVEGASATITVKRLGGNRGLVSVDWYVDSDSAVSDLDFAVQSGTLTWADGDVSDKTITVTTIADTTPEGTEQFVVRLHNPQGGTTIALPFDAYISIEDEDAPNGTPPGGCTTWSSLTRQTFVSETNAVRFIELVRSGANDAAPYARLRVRLSDGTATENADYDYYSGPAIMDAPMADAAVATWYTNGDIPGGYTLVWAGDNDVNYDPPTALGDLPTGGNDAEVYVDAGGTEYLVFIAGNVKAQVPVQILGDTVIEPIESVHLRVDSPHGTNLGTAASSDHDYQDCSIFITDDDASSQTTIISEAINCAAVVIAVPDRIIAAGATSNLPIRVTPTAAGYWQFRVTVVNNDANEPNFTWLVNGNSRADVPDMAVARNGAYIPDAGTDPVNGLIAGFPTALTYTISNAGTDPLTVTTPATVAAVNNCAVAGGAITSTTINVNSYTTMGISVTPTSAGAWSATITIANNDPDENPYNITLQGIATAAPAPEFQWYRYGSTLTAVATGGTDDRSDLSFIAGVSYTVEYRVANIGSADLTWGGADTVSAVTNTSAPVDPALAGPIVANAMKPVSFTFTPTAAGTFSFTYDIAGTNDSDEANPSITISGTAAAAAPEAAIYRVANLIPNGFDDAPAGLVATQSTVLTYGISNQGSQNLTLTLPVVISAETNCTAVVVTPPAASIVPGATSQLQISVTPTSAGAYSFTVAIPSNDTDENPITWDVVASADQAPVARPEVQVRRNGVDLADASIDAVGPILAGNPLQLSYAIDNLGSDLLTLGLPSIASTSNCAVTVLAAPAANVGAASGTTMLLEVTPTAGGVGWSFTWSVPTNDVGEDPTNITVVGTGLAPTGPEIVVDRNNTTVADGGADAVGATYTGVTTTLAYTVTNTGTSDLVLDPTASISATSNCTATITAALPSLLAANAEADLQIAVVPSGSPWSFVLTIPTNDTDENPHDFTVSGTATAPPAEISVALSAADVADASTATVNPTTNSFSYVITNTGLATLSLTAISGTSTGGLSAGPTLTHGALPISVAPGGSTTVVVAVTPTNAATTAWDFSISITNNDDATDGDTEEAYSWTVTAPVAPEIAVSRSSVDKAHDATASVTFSTDPASDTVSGSGIGLASDLTYAVSNTGVSVLNITSVTVISATNCTTSILDGLPATLTGGSSDNLIVRVTPAAAAATGGWWCLVRIVSDDADENPFNLTIASDAPGSATPEIVVSRSGTNIASGSTDTVAGGMALTPASLTYTIQNTGLGGLTFGTAPAISGLTNCTVLVTTNPSNTISAGASSSLVMQVTPSAGGAWSFGVSLSNNDTDENPMLWTVAGVADAFAVTPGTLGLSGGGGGCGAGATGLVILALSLFGLRLRRSNRR